jgi:hypothetical protein
MSGPEIDFSFDDDLLDRRFRNPRDCCLALVVRALARARRTE